VLAMVFFVDLASGYELTAIENFQGRF
jgi:hypothetical protein